MAKKPEAETIANRIIAKKEQELGKRLSDKEKKAIQQRTNKILKRQAKEEKEEAKKARKNERKNSKGIRKWPKLVALLSALGITAVFGQKLLDAPKEDIAINKEEPEQESKRKGFLESLQEDNYTVSKEDLEQYKSIYPEKSDIEKAVNQLKDKGDIEAFLKDMYIEQYEEITGDATLTTADIEFDFNNEQDYIFVNPETGERVTHGAYPDTTKSMLDGNYKYEEDVNVIMVKSIETGETLDAATMKSIDGKYSAVKVVLGDNYNEMKDYTSVLANSNDENLANIIRLGLQYAEKIEDKDQKESAKQQFVQALEEADKGNIEQENQGYEIDD